MKKFLKELIYPKTYTREISSIMPLPRTRSKNKINEVEDNKTRKDQKQDDINDKKAQLESLLSDPVLKQHYTTTLYNNIVLHY